MTQTAATAASADKDAIRRFHVHFPDEELADLRRRIKATRWPEKERKPAEFPAAGGLPNCGNHLPRNPVSRLRFPTSS
jgi:hypothetical protein